MKISQDLPQFENEKALLVVTGAQEAEFHLASDGEINELEEFKRKKPTYTDKEGFFARSGLGRALGFGSTKKDTKDEMRQKFLSQLDKTLKRLSKKVEPDFTYVFAPEYMHKNVEEQVNKWISKNVGKTFPGNFFDRPPAELLEMIRERVEDKVDESKKQAASDEARKILGRGQGK